MKYSKRRSVKRKSRRSYRRKRSSRRRSIRNSRKKTVRRRSKSSSRRNKGRKSRRVMKGGGVNPLLVQPPPGASGLVSAAAEGAKIAAPYLVGLGVLGAAGLGVREYKKRKKEEQTKVKQNRNLKYNIIQAEPSAEAGKAATDPVFLKLVINVPYNWKKGMDGFSNGDLEVELGDQIKIISTSGSEDGRITASKLDSEEEGSLPVMYESSDGTLTSIISGVVQ